MGRFLRFLLLIMVIAAIAAAAYVAVSDIPPPKRELVQEVPADVLFPND